MALRVISEEGYIIHRDKVEKVYGGCDDVSSHVILVPANRLTPEKVNDSYNEGPDGGIYFRVNVECFKHCGLGEYRKQLEENFGDEIPFSVISRNSVLLFRPNGFQSFEVEEEVYGSVVKEWPFCEELGRGREFLQVAHVYGMRNIDSLPGEKIIDFLRRDPLRSLTDRKGIARPAGKRAGNLNQDDKFILSDYFRELSQSRGD